MKLKLHRQNVPHRAMGPYGKGSRKPGIKAGAHVAQRTNTGFDDRAGYRGSAQAAFGSKLSGKAPRIPREAGHYHPVGHGSSRLFAEESREALRMNREVTGHEASARRDGYHTGKPSKGDTNIRKGPQGNSKGSAPPGTGKGMWVRGTPESHAGTAGRGAPGKFGKGDGYKGKSAAYPEEISHEQFEKLGAA